MRNLPLISVVMCTYNGAAFLDEQMESIISQDYNHIEIIVCDDCSSDNTVNVLNSWKSRYPNLINIYQNKINLGYNKNFVQALNYAKGELIAIADQDDIWLKDKLSSLEKLLRNEKHLLAHCASANFSKDSSIIRSENLSLSFMFSGNDIRKLLFKNTISGHNMLFKHSLVKHLTKISNPVYYDWFIAGLAACQGIIIPLPAVKVKRRLHQANAFRSNGIKKLSQIEAVRIFIQELLQSEQIPKEHLPFVAEACHLVEYKIATKLMKFDCRLFWFLFRNRNIIFSYKKRANLLSQQFSYLKAAFRLAYS